MENLNEEVRKELKEINDKIKKALEMEEPEEIDQTKLSPTATELIAKYGNASTIIGNSFVLAGDFDYRDKAKKELEDYIAELETQNQELMIRNNDKDAEIERLNATIDRQQWSELVHRIQKECEE